MSDLIMKYFVLKPSGNDIYARASRKAMAAYADTIIDDDRDFALAILKWVDDEIKESKK